MSGTLVETLSADGKVPAKRLKDAQAAHAAYTRVKDGDDASSKNRAKLLAMLNGEPPFRHADLVETGQADRCNLNFNDARAIRDAALAGYYDLTSSTEVMFDVTTEFGPPDMHPVYSQKISRRFDDMLKNWPEFESSYQTLITHLIDLGVSCAYWEDEVNWQFKVGSLMDFKIPRQTRATERAIEIATCRRVMQAHELYRFISDPESAKENGWNAALGKKLLTNVGDNNDASKFDAWEAFEREMTNNDLGYSGARASEVPVIHYWVQEFDGTVSHMIGADSGTETEFLFEAPSRFDSMSEAFVFFTFGVGNGTYHGIPGLLFRIYPHIQLLNRLRGQLVDGAMLSSALLVQPIDSTSRALEELSITYYGPYAILPPGLKTIERTTPNLAQSVLPVVSDLTMNLQNNTANFQSRAVTPDGQARTATEIRSQLQSESTLTASSINLIYPPLKRLGTQIFRRVAREDYVEGEPGWAEVCAFKKALLHDEVPLEALSHISQVEPRRAFGMGSAGMRVLALDEAMNLSGLMDEVGKKNVARDRLAARFGYSAVERYLPSGKDATRPVVDEKIAELENGELRQGVPVSVKLGENHSVHAKIVLMLIQQVGQQLAEGQGDPQQVLAVLTVAVPHLAQHVQHMAQDPQQREEAAQLAQVVQQTDATRQRLDDQLKAQAEQQQKAQEAEAQRQLSQQQAYVQDLEAKQAQQQEGGGQADPKTIAMIQQHQAKLQSMQQEAELKRNIRQAEAMQKIAIDDAKAAAQIRRT